MTDSSQYDRKANLDSPTQPEKDSHLADTPADQSRRNFSRRLGVTAPILMTLASRPAFGGNCLSNMMSGNLSDPDRGECGPGWSPVEWRNPGGSINGMPTLNAWQQAGYDYGVFPANPVPPGCNNTDLEPLCYSGGTLLNQTPLAACFGGETRSMREILIDDLSSDAAHCITALLNASLSANSSTFNYILTVDQVVGLCCGTIPLPPGYISLTAFLSSTWF